MAEGENVSALPANEQELEQAHEGVQSDVGELHDRPT
jgi:hypothetical protein